MSDTNSGGIRVAAAPVSWGVFEQRADDPLRLEPETMLDQMVQAGYSGTELGPPGYFGDALQIKARLGSRGLSLVGNFMPLRFSRREHIEADLDSLRADLETMASGRPDQAMPLAILADASTEPDRMRWAGQIEGHPETHLSDERHELMVGNIHRAAAICRESGLDAVLHFHAGSYIETDREIHRVFDVLDTTLVGMCLDTGHALFGGADPLELLATYGECVRLVHIKDCDLDVLGQVCRSGGGLMEAWDRGVFCELGQGTAGLDAFLEALREGAYEGWLTVEQDRFLKPQDTAEALLALHTRNREWLTQRGF